MIGESVLVNDASFQCDYSPHPLLLFIFKTLLGGIAPHRVLPITLDVGTNNPELLKDPSYVGIQKNRLVGDEYFDFVDEFMQVQSELVVFLAL